MSLMRSVTRYERNRFISRILVYGGSKGSTSSIVRQLSGEVSRMASALRSLSLKRSPFGSPASSIYTTRSSRPIISHNCFFCQGVEARLANLIASLCIFVSNESLTALEYSLSMEYRRTRASQSLKLSYLRQLHRSLASGLPLISSSSVISASRLLKRAQTILAAKLASIVSILFCSLRPESSKDQSSLSSLCKKLDRPVYSFTSYCVVRE